jgi:uncharacterized protein (TIGR00369 family)
MSAGDTGADDSKYGTARIEYPPHDHLLRDLRVFIERGPDGAHAGLEVNDWICTDVGGVRAGVLATLVDIIAGEQSARAVRPDWIATSDLVLHLFAPATHGTVYATPNIIRQGRTTVVIEVSLGHAPRGATLGLATLTFSRIPARSEVQTMDDRAEIPRTDFARAGSGLDTPFTTKLGARMPDDDAGSAEMPVTPYNANSIGALSGGAMATLIDLSTEAIGRAHGEANWVTTDFAIHYLAPGRHGPVFTRSRPLRMDSASTLTRIEVHDRGAGNRLIAVATATAEALR